MSIIMYDNLNINKIGIDITAKISLKYLGKIYLCYAFMSDFCNMNIPIHDDLINFMENNHEVRYDKEKNIMLFKVGPDNKDNYKTYILYEHASSYLPVDLLNRIDYLTMEVNRINKLILENDINCSESININNVKSIKIYDNIATIHFDTRIIELPYEEIINSNNSYDVLETTIIDNRTEEFDIIEYIKPKMIIINMDDNKKSMRKKDIIFEHMENKNYEFLNHILVLKLEGNLNRIRKDIKDYIKIFPNLSLMILDKDYKIKFDNIYYGDISNYEEVITNDLI